MMANKQFQFIKNKVNSILGISLKDGIIVKLILFVLALALLILLILLPLHCVEKKKSNNKAKKVNKNTKEEKNKGETVANLDSFVPKIVEESK